MRPILWLVPGIAATLIGGVAVAVVLIGDSGPTLALGLILHVAACGLATFAGNRRRADDLSESEIDAMLLCAVSVPLFGPATAWLLPRRLSGVQVVNAHEIVERYAEHTAPQIPDWERTLFTGDHDPDVARELDVQTYAEVLRQGGMVQKRNALRGLSRMGRERDVARLRACLSDTDVNLRIYAYGELENLQRRHERAIQAAAQASEDEPESADAHVTLAHAHLAIATSGVLDPAAAAFHDAGAARDAARALELDPELLEAIVVGAHALTRLSRYDAARACLAAVSPTLEDHPDVRLERARLAYAVRDLEGVRREAVHLRDTLSEPGEWLDVLTAGGALATPGHEPDPDRAPARDSTVARVSS